MSGLHEAFDEIVADVPVYGDLDRAIEQAERDRRRRYAVIAGLAAAAAVLVVIAGVFAVSRDDDGAPSPAPSPTPSPAPVATDGSIYFAAESSAGEALTDLRSFGEVETDPKQMDIYLSRKGQPVRRIIGTSAHERCPAVSPDGSRLAYLEGATVVIARLDADGTPGAPDARVNLKADGHFQTARYRPSNVAGPACPQWSPDGQRLGYQVTRDDQDTTVLDFTVTAEVHAVTLDGDDNVVASFDTRVWHPEPPFAWSPDGDEIAYGTVEGVWRAPLNGKAAELVWRAEARQVPLPGPKDDISGVIPHDPEQPISLTWSSHNQLAFSVLEDPDVPPMGPKLVVVDADSGKVLLETNAGSVREGGAGEAWSPDGLLLVFTGPDGRIRLNDRVTGSTVRVRPQLGDGTDVSGPAWSPDGDELLARAHDDARGFALVSLALDGSSSEVRTPWTWSLDWASLDDVDWSSR